MTASDSTTRRAFIRNSLYATSALALSCTRPAPAAREAVRAAAPPPRPADAERTDLDAGLDASRASTTPASSEATPDSAAAGATSSTTTHPRPLLARYPALAGALPWMDLGGLPTPVSHQERLGRHLGIGALYVKHDDRAGETYGGSKARKLEHLLAEAVRLGARTVLTFGGVGSNHALATAVQAERLGLGCRLLLLPERPSEHAREHLLAEHRLGCEQHRARGVDRDEARRVLGARFERESPYVIPAGGTSPLGNAGYVNAALELAEQCAAGELPVPDLLYVAAGTTGTAAGLYVGLRAAGLPTRLVAVRASNPGTGSLRHLRGEIEATAQYLRGLDPSFPEVEITSELLHLEHGAAGPGYAIPTPEGERATELARELAAIELDPTYTAKSFAGLIAHAPRLTDRAVLFWNTFDPRHVSPGDVEPEDLPRAFRGYFR